MFTWPWRAFPLIPCSALSHRRPYWGLRNYGIKGQIGLEPTLAGFIQALTAVFAEVRRVLKPDGILWLNIGDGYTSGNRGWQTPDKKNPDRCHEHWPGQPAWPQETRI